MMNKFILGVVVALLVSGVVLTSTAKAQEDYQISPRQWVLETEGLEVVDVHIAIPLSVIDRDSVNVVIGGEVDVDVMNLAVGADSRGDLVIKFIPDLSLLEDGDLLDVKVSFNYLDEEVEVFENVFENIEVKEAVMLRSTVSE